MLREEGWGKLHQQAKDATLRALLRLTLSRRGGLKRAPKGVQGERGERWGVEASMLQAPCGHCRASRLGH